MRNLGVRRGRWVMVATAMALALLAAPGAASADTGIGGGGPVGIHAVTHTSDGAGAACAYQDSDGRDGPAEAIVFGARLRARDRTGGTDTQTVGWQVRIEQRSVGGAAWHTTFSSTVLKKTATDAAAATFRTHRYAVPVDGRVRVVERLVWYQPGSTTKVEGWRSVRIGTYERSHHILVDTVSGSCPRVAAWT